MGADYVINHHKDLKSQIKEIIGIDYADYLLTLYSNYLYYVTPCIS